MGYKGFACPHKGRRQGEGTSASGRNRGQRVGGIEMQTAEAGPSHVRDGGVDESGCHVLSCCVLSLSFPFTLSPSAGRC